MGWRVGVDVGGTFTDVVLVDEEGGGVCVVKVPTTPHDFAEAVLAGLRQGLARYRVEPAAVTLLSHATTVVTNALLERKGARAGFVTTSGFRDVLELRRSSRADLYDLLQDAPAVLVPRRWRFEVGERIDAQGEIVTPLDEADIDRVIDAVRAAGLDTVAVSLLFSFLNDKHERRLGERLRRALPGVGVYLSCEILPEIREFERASTTAVCAYVGPLLAGYLDRLQQAVTAIGLPQLYLMGSSGGVFDVAEGLRMPAMAIESGPAAGVIAAQLAGKELGLPNLISFDMGGTTAKASLIADGEVAVTAEYEVGGSGHAKRWLHGTGHPVRVPVIDLAEVSAGGGSIAWVDPGGALKVGPKSAGAEPGPAAYGKGGTEPTVSDADIVLGRLDREALLGGALPIDAAAAEAAVREHVARPLGLGIVEAAAAIVEIVDSNMAEALRIVSVERGHDPREFALIAFGGAGPVHAAALAAELDIPEIVVPPAPGAFSALGLVATDLKRDYSRTLYAELASIDPARVGGALAEIEDIAKAMLAAGNIPPERRVLRRAADLRYRRQAYELTVPLADGPIVRAWLDALAAAFHEQHRQTYGHANPAEPVQLVNLRVTAIGRLARPSLALRPAGPATARPAREVWFAETGSVRCPVYWRDGLAAGARIDGPAIIEAMDSTIVVPPGWTAAAGAAGYLRLRRTGLGQKPDELYQWSGRSVAAGSAARQINKQHQLQWGLTPMTMSYAETYRRSLERPEEFWAEAAEAIGWERRWDRVLDDSRPPFYRWFAGGRLNTCWNALDRHVAAGRGERTALIWDSPVTGQIRRFTYRGLRDAVAQLAGVLVGLGVGRGDRVLIYMPMVPEAAMAMLACARIGAVHSVVFGGFAAHELATRIDDAQPRVVLSASCGIEVSRVIPYKPLLDAAVAEARSKPEHCVILQRPMCRAELVAGRDHDWEELAAAARPADCVPVAATDPLYILYTSGTTGVPKGVVRDNGGHAVALRWSLPNIYGVGPDDVFWTASDVGWVVGHSYIVYAPLLLGCTTVMYEGKPVGTPDAGAFWRVVEQHRVNVFFTAPTAFRAIKREDPDGRLIRGRDLGQFRALFLAGERADPPTVAWAEQQLRIPVIDHWWQTETGWPIVANCLGIERLPVKHGSATRAVPGWDVRVLDAEAEDAARELPAGEIGALALKLPLPPGALPTLWRADDKFVAAYLSAFPGFYQTADAGLVDADGYIHVMTRTDDIINVAGHRLSTGGIEEVLAAHPDVAECAVIGVADALKGQVPLGLLVLKAGAARRPEEVEAEAVRLVRDRIGPVASFRTALVVAGLPKTRSGKILRGTMRRIADGEDYPLPATIDDPAVLGDIGEALAAAGYAGRPTG